MQIIEFIFSGKGLLPFRDLFDATEERKGHAVESSRKCEYLTIDMAGLKFSAAPGPRLQRKKRIIAKATQVDLLCPLARWDWARWCTATHRWARATARRVPLFQARPFYMSRLPFGSAGV